MCAGVGVGGGGGGGGGDVKLVFLLSILVRISSWRILHTTLRKQVGWQVSH